MGVGGDPAKGSGGAVSTEAFTWQDVAKHTTEQSAWVIFRDSKGDSGVYDITEWLDKHPGGKEMLLLSAGRDCTDIMASYHPFTDKPEKYLKSMRIGTLRGAPEFPVYPPDSGFYKEIRTRVKQYFDDNNLDPKSPWAGLWRMAVVFAVAAFTFGVMNNVVMPGSPWVARIAAALVFGVCQALPLLHVMHDASHTAIGHTELWWKVVGRFCLDFFAGASMVSWHHQHVVGHHIFTNVMGVDPDLPASVSGDPRRLVQQQRWAKMYKWQHLYLPPLYGILGLRSRIVDFTATWTGNNGPVRVNWYSSPFMRLVVTKIIWAAWRLALPLFVWGVPAMEYWTLFFIAEFTTGYWLAFNFQVSHVSSVADFPNDKGNVDVLPDEWAVSQVKTSVDYGHGSWVTAFLSGALNYQTVHHLLPTVSQYHYPAITPIVQDVCRKFNVPFRRLDNFSTAFSLHLQHLRELGQEGKAAHID